MYRIETGAVEEYDELEIEQLPLVEFEEPRSIYCINSFCATETTT